MAFLVANGIEIPVASGSASREVVRLGTRSRSFNGRARKSYRAEKREWRLRMPPLPYADALAYSGLLEGRGHYFPFTEDLYSTKGLGGVPSGTIDFTTGTLLVDSGASVVIAFPGSDYTLALDFGDDISREQYVIRSDGAKWEGGVRNDALDTSAWLVVDADAGVVTVTLSTGYYGPSRLLPYRVLDAWAAAGLNTADAGAQPLLLVTGDIVGAEELSCIAEVSGSSVTEFQDSSGWEAGEVLDLVLAEV